jgi:integrase
MSRGNVTRRGKDSWRLKFDIAADPVTGARRTKFATVRGNKRDAEKELTRRISEAEDGVNLAPEKLLTGEFIERWLEDTIKPSVRARTYEGYDNIAQGHLIPHLGKIPLKKLTPMHIQAYHSSKAKGGLSAQTIIHHHRL